MLCCMECEFIAVFVTCMCRSDPLYRAFYIPLLSKKYTKYADYVLLLNKVLFENIKKKLTPDYRSATY